METSTTRRARRRAWVLAVAVGLLGVAAPGQAHEVPTGYRWLDPPPGATVTEPPGSQEASLRIRQGPVRLWTPDLQMELDFPLDASDLAPELVLSLTPAQVATVGLPDEAEFAMGNAYVVDLAGAGGSVTDGSGTATLATPHPATSVWTDASGTWESLPPLSVRDDRVTVPFPGPGAYVAVAEHPVGDGGGGVPVAVVVGVAGVLVGAGAFLRSRRTSTA